ncbi:hypothetical protein PR048_007756 [Dryococelus australis]|uniref:Uncharacterized protein n=1 Tax=Dryococelus australis TaxID=614101 RepID=A0ABQ9HV52_9NEOP|nr:hypothetical protein PR048_007756 [Dryococelus australis]
MMGPGKREMPEKTRRPTASYGTIPTCANPRATPLGIEPGSPRGGRRLCAFAALKLVNCSLSVGGAAVLQRLERFPSSHPPPRRTEFDFWRSRSRISCRAMPLFGRFSWGSTDSPAVAHQRCAIIASLHPHRLSRKLHNWTGDPDEVYFEPMKLAVRNLKPRSATIIHEISLVQHFYIGTKIKLDHGLELGSLDLGSAKMLVQPGISRGGLLVEEKFVIALTQQCGHKETVKCAFKKNQCPKTNLVINIYEANERVRDIKQKWLDNVQRMAGVRFSEQLKILLKLSKRSRKRYPDLNRYRHVGDRGLNSVFVWSILTIRFLEDFYDLVFCPAPSVPQMEKLCSDHMGMQQRRSPRTVKTGDPRENPLTCPTRFSREGAEPGSPRYYVNCRTYFERRNAAAVTICKMQRNFRRRVLFLRDGRLCVPRAIVPKHGAENQYASPSSPVTVEQIDAIKAGRPLCANPTHPLPSSSCLTNAAGTLYTARRPAQAAILRGRDFRVFIWRQVRLRNILCTGVSVSRSLADAPVLLQTAGGTEFGPLFPAERNCKEGMIKEERSIHDNFAIQKRGSAKGESRTHIACLVASKRKVLTELECCLPQAAVLEPVEGTMVSAWKGGGGVTTTRRIRPSITVTNSQSEVASNSIRTPSGGSGEAALVFLRAVAPGGEGGTGAPHVAACRPEAACVTEGCGGGGPSAGQSVTAAAAAVASCTKDEVGRLFVSSAHVLNIDLPQRNTTVKVVLAEKQFSVGTRRLVERSRRDLSTSSLVYAPSHCRHRKLLRFGFSVISFYTTSLRCDSTEVVFVCRRGYCVPVSLDAVPIRLTSAIDSSAKLPTVSDVCQRTAMRVIDGKTAREFSALCVRGDERVDVHISVAPSAPNRLGLGRAKFVHPGGHRKGIDQNAEILYSRLVAESEYLGMSSGFHNHGHQHYSTLGRKHRTLARRSDEALGVCVSVARIAPSLLDLGRAAT